MRISEMTWQGGRIATFRALDPFPVERGNEVVLLSSTREREVLLSFIDGSSLLRAEPRDSTARLLLEELNRGEKNVRTWISSVQDSTIILCSQKFLTSVFFPNEAPLRVLITEQIADDISTPLGTNMIAFLREQFLAGDTAIAQAGKEIESFRLIGPKWTLDVNRGRMGLRTTSLRKRRSHPFSERLTLLRGDVRFEDATLLGTHAEVISTQLNDVLQSGGSYLETWEIYNDLETVLLQQTAEEFGSIQYESYSSSYEDGTKIYVFNSKHQVPVPFRRDELPIEVVPLDHDTSSKQAVLIGETLPQTAKNQLRVRASDEFAIPPRVGELCISQRGDQTRIKRRRQALDIIAEGRAPLLNLKLLLKTGIAPVPDTRHHQPITDRIRRLFPERSPTAAQEEALDIALNTPDIALIQGPPGTGKTSVIKALVARIAELESQKDRSRTHLGEAAAVLITSAQHDAVENAVAGIDVGGLPAYRFGRRRGQTDEDRDYAILEWIRGRRSACNKNLANFGGTPSRQLARSVDRLIDQWRQTLTEENRTEITLSIFEQVKKCLDPVLVQRLIDAISLTQRPLPQGSYESEVDDRLRQRLARLISAQRTTTETFAEDGRIQAERLLSFLKNNSDVFDLPIPKEIGLAANGEVENLEFFSKFEAALLVLRLGRLLTAPEQDDTARTDSLSELWNEISAALHERTRNSRDAIAEALEAFVEELEDVDDVRAMIQKYAQVVAATCQQAVSQDYAGGRAQFDTVVVDEAARAHPLDLLIPLSRGKRIVLVGDHHQLPQMLEPEVKDAYLAAHPEADTTLLEQSVFERLFEQFKEIQEQGGPRRVVTLKDDFRMHPTISRFVSSNFYKDTDIVPRCRVEDRQHGLHQFEGKPLVWIDVPRDRGGEDGDRHKSKSKSKSRSVEVEVLFEELEKILNGAREHSIGVITFYGKQEEMLEKRRAELPYEQRERVRVGTVDSFQGKEFDVVLLSTVRSNGERQDLRQRVGFLDSRNRLCVALSRGRRLLVTIGDAETVAGSTRQPAVPELLALVEACKGSEGYYELR